MTSTQAPRPDASATVVTTVGMALGLAAVFVGILLPFFVPPVLKMEGFLTLFRPITFTTAWSKANLSPMLKHYPLTYVLLRDILRILFSPIVLCALIGPAIGLFGLYRQQKRAGAPYQRSLQLLFGGQLVIGSFVWMVWQSAQLAQTGWLAFRQGAMAFATQYPAIFWGPILILVGLALISDRSWRAKLGLILAGLAYHLLIATALYLYFAKVLTKQFPMRFQPPAKAEVASIIGFARLMLPIYLIAGTAMLEKGMRLRFHLLMTSPLWVPFFVVFFFWSLIVNTTFYFIEDLTGHSFQPPTWLKVVFFSWLCLPLFPLLLTLDFCVSLIRYLGQATVDQLFPPQLDAAPEEQREVSPLWTNALGALLLLTVPLWILPAFLYWGARLFIVESLLQSLQGRPQEPHKY